MPLSTRRTKLAMLAAILFATSAFASIARADEKDACVAAHSSGQVSRKDGKTRAARASFLTCASDKCPPLVKRDCTQWYQEMEAAAPSIILEVHDVHGLVESNAVVQLDGEPFPDYQTGTPHELDPGEHSLRIDLPSGDHLEQKFVTFTGAKNQHVIVWAKAPPSVVPPPAPRAEQPPPVTNTARRIPTLAFITGGVTIAGLGVFAGFALAGLSKEDDLRHTCAPFCAQSDVDTAKRDYLIGDIGLGVAVVAAAATVYVLLTTHDSRPVASITSRAP